MQLRKFVRDDWSWVQAWFQDDLLNRELGPLDRAWLEHVRVDADGVQLVAMEGDTPVALVGCVWGDGREIPHAITDIAVAPDRRNAGIGRPVLSSVFEWRVARAAGFRVAFTDPGSIGARCFFRALAWRDCGMDGDMRRFETPAP